MAENPPGGAIRPAGASHARSRAALAVGAGCYANGIQLFSAVIEVAGPRYRTYTLVRVRERARRRVGA